MNFFRRFNSIVFDCDGTILESKDIKSSAFKNAALYLGEEKADELLRYHKKHGGISRYSKFEHFCHQILGLKDYQETLTTLLNNYANLVDSGLRNCRINPALARMYEDKGDCVWYVASGGDQKELRRVLHQKGISGYFDGGIFGSPETKMRIVEDIMCSEKFRSPALMIGDSAYDYEVADTAGLDFLFVEEWSDIGLSDFPHRSTDFAHVNSLEELLTNSGPAR